MEKLNNIQFVINELIESIKKDTIEQENTSEKISHLEKKIAIFYKNSTHQFIASHNIGNLRNIIQLLLEIIKNQEKRISDLE
jgi:hypothetical protein